MSPAEPDLVRAAGGVVWRERGDGEVEVLLVHRPKYDDWTLPKGKCDPGESDESCALREVHEETGLRCRLGIELVSTYYDDARGRPKVVRYWTMRVVDGAFSPNAEVDEVEWVGLEEAGMRLSYDRDQPVLASFDALAPDARS